MGALLRDKHPGGHGMGLGDLEEKEIKRMERWAETIAVVMILFGLAAFMVAIWVVAND